MAMEFLFRYGGLMVIKTAQIMNLTHSTVSKERKRMRERLEKDAGLRREFKRIESKLSKVKPVRFYTGLYTTGKSRILFWIHPRASARGILTG